MLKPTSPRRRAPSSPPGGLTDSRWPTCVCSARLSATSKKTNCHVSTLHHKQTVSLATETQFLQWEVFVLMWRSYSTLFDRDLVACSYRRGLSQVLLRRRSAVLAAVGGLMVHGGGVPRVVILIGGVNVLLPSNRWADLRQRTSPHHPALRIVLWSHTVNIHR